MGLPKESILLLLLAMHSTRHHAFIWGAWALWCCGLSKFSNMSRALASLYVTPLSHLCSADIHISSYSVRVITNFSSALLGSIIKCVTSRSSASWTLLLDCFQEQFFFIELSWTRFQWKVSAHLRMFEISFCTSQGSLPLALPILKCSMSLYTDRCWWTWSNDRDFLSGAQRQWEGNQAVVFQ